MGIFYNPPQPPTASNAGTPPEPHAPIGTQGSQPPRYSTVLMMAAVLVSWPADLEPRLQTPNNQQNKIAPLTLAYGQQPPKYSIAARMAQAVNAWPLDLEPRLGRPNDQPQKIAPLTLAYGSQPPPIAPIAIAELTPIVASWQQSWDAQRAPKSLAWDVPISPYLARTPLPASIWTAWEPLPLPPPRPVQIAPLTLAYGGQPTPQPPLSTLELAQIVGTWAQTWGAQTAPRSAAWDIPAIVSALVPRTPPPALIWTAWIEPFVRPPTPVAIAPLTLTYGDAPPVRGTSPFQAQIAGTWADPLIVQAGPKTAAWNVPAIVAVIVPANAFPYGILRAWQEEPARPPRLVTIAPLTLSYGSQPPVQGPQIAGTRIALQAWPPDLEPRLGRPNDQRVRIAPLTLVYGNPPTPHGPLSSTLLRVLTGAWEPPWHISGLYLHGNYVPGSFIPPPPPTGVYLLVADVAVTLIDVADVAIQVVAIASDGVVTTLTVTDVLLITS